MIESPFVYPQSTEIWGGLTLRDYFAAAAMQGHLSCPESDATMDFVATVSYEYADAMLRERAKCTD
jgi:hypothetical protein